MSTEVMVALITTGGVVLVAAGAGARYIISTIIDAYKHQASQTVDAKDAEIARLRDGVTADLKTIRDDLAELRQDVWTLRRDGSP